MSFILLQALLYVLYIISLNSQVGNALSPVLPMRKPRYSVVTDSPGSRSGTPSTAWLLLADVYIISIKPLDNFDDPFCSAILFH